MNLNSLNPGDEGTIVEITSKDTMRRRMCDLGIIPKTRIKCVFKSPLGDPGAYLVRGAVIALRKNDCNDIYLNNINLNNNNLKQKTIAVAGNPNVGKSTVFNGLTGMKQHTGNWPGKTVENARGYCKSKKYIYKLVDIPGTYSLMAHSPEEETARDFLCFGENDGVIVVCDATCMCRNLNLLLQIMEITNNVVLCVNLMDEAKRKNIKPDLEKLSKILNIPVAGTVARDKKSLKKILNLLDNLMDNLNPENKITVKYPPEIEKAISIIEKYIIEKNIIKKNIIKKNILKTETTSPRINTRFAALRLLEGDESFTDSFDDYIKNTDLITEKITRAKEYLKIDNQKLKDTIINTIMEMADEIYSETVTDNSDKYNSRDTKIDRILTGKITAYPLMGIFLALIFYLTIMGANYPSQLLADILFKIQDKIELLFEMANAPAWLSGLLVSGVYRVLAWVVSVMLPPMAIFFPLFTILEDLGCLPRVAFNLDRPFCRCKACGKQALTMCMGFGCNAVGVTGCRIIDSPRERLLAILTNSFVPCNGRFPTIIAILTIFFVMPEAGFFGNIMCAIFLSLIIIFSVFITFAVTKILSETILKGVPSSYTLELPPYRRPDVGKIIVRSVFDRTLRVLKRAVIAAIPAGIIIYILANVEAGGTPLLNICAGALDPFAMAIGLDGVILMAFILGFPANEIVIPIIIMAYMSKGSILEPDSYAQMKNIFVDNGWNHVTALCTILFSLMHWPCATTLMTIKKETKSIKWALLAALIPAVTGVIICFFAKTILMW